MGSPSTESALISLEKACDPDGLHASLSKGSVVRDRSVIFGAVEVCSELVKHASRVTRKIETYFCLPLTLSRFPLLNSMIIVLSSLLVFLRVASLRFPFSCIIYENRPCWPFAASVMPPLPKYKQPLPNSTRVARAECSPRG